MDERLGFIFRQLRQAKGITLRDMADYGILSKSQLERFENGSSDIPASKLLRLIAATQVSAEEFVTAWRGFRTDDFEQLFTQIGRCEQAGDFAALADLQQAETDSFAANGDSAHRITALVIKSVLAVHQAGPGLTGVETGLLHSCLESRQGWGRYELNVFIGALPHLDTESAVAPLADLWSQPSHYSEVPGNLAQVFKVVRDMAFVCLQRHDLNQADKVLDDYKRLVGSHGSLKDRLDLGLLTVISATARQQYDEAAHQLEAVVFVEQRFGNSPYLVRVHLKQLKSLRALSQGQSGPEPDAVAGFCFFA